MATLNYINTGSGVNTGDGDSLRTAFTKINNNFDFLVDSFVAAGVTSWNGRVGVVNFTNTDLINILGFVPYPAANPEGYVTSSTIALSNYAPLDYVNTSFVFVSDLSVYNFASVSYVDLKLTEYPTLAFLNDQQYITSLTLPTFLDDYVTETELGAAATIIRNYTDDQINQNLRNNNIIPIVADNYNLGAEDYRWATLYLSNAVYIQGIGISTDPTTGRLLVDGNSPIADFTFSPTSIVSNNSNFSLFANGTASVDIPANNGSDTPLRLFNNGPLGIVFEGSDTTVTIDSAGKVGIAITTNFLGPIKFKGDNLTTYPGIIEDHTLEFTGNTEYVNSGTTATAFMHLSAYSSTKPEALTIRGSKVALFASTVTDFADFEVNPGYVALDTTGLYIGNNFQQGNGDLDNAWAFDGYRLPLTRGSVGQVLAISNTAGTYDTVNWTTLAGGGNLTAVNSHILPSADLTYDLGSTSSQWRSLYVGTSTIYLGGTALSVSGGNITIDGSPIVGGGGESLSDRLTSSTYSVILEGTTGTVSVPNAIISQGYQLNLAGSQSSYDIGRYLRVRDGDFESHLHLDTPDNSLYDIILGDDSKFVRVDHTGTVVIGTNGVSSHNWTFDNNGILEVPGSIIPNTDLAYDLGSPTKRFNDLYLSTTTIYLGTSTVSISADGQMLVNGNAATASLEYFGTEGFGPRNAHYAAWIDSKIYFAGVGSELKGAIYDLKPGNKIRLFQDPILGLLDFTIAGTARFVNDLTHGESLEIDITELNTYTGFSPLLYLSDIYLPVKERTAILENGTWTVAVSTTGTVVYPDDTEQSTAYIPNSIGLSWIITPNGSSDFVFNGPGIVAGNTHDPILYLYRGFTYKFINTNGVTHPFAIRVSNGGAAYTSGVTGSNTGTQIFTVPMDAPSTLYYQCTIHSNMGNTINIV